MILYYIKLYSAHGPRKETSQVMPPAAASLVSPRLCAVPQGCPGMTRLQSTWLSLKSCGKYRACICIFYVYAFVYVYVHVCTQNMCTRTHVCFHVDVDVHVELHVYFYMYMSMHIPTCV